MPNKKKKSKAPRNAFSFFLDDAVIDLRKQGHAVSNKFDAVALVYDKWKAMTLIEKRPYQDRADMWKMEKNCTPGIGRLDCTGQPVDNRINLDVETAFKRQQQRENIRKHWITNDRVSKEYFYLISFNSYYEFPNEEGYQPCEVACVKFALREGIVKEWHAFINPGPIRLGLGAEAKIFSEKTHKIPIYDFEYGRKDYFVIWNELLDFVKDDSIRGVLPPLYSKTDEIKKTEFCLNYLSQYAGVSNKLSKLYHLEDLICELYEKIGLNPPSNVVLDDALSSSLYDYENNTKCEYHHDIENIHCALLNIKKPCFWMSTAFSEVYGYELTENHTPVSEPAGYVVLKPDEVDWNEQHQNDGCQPVTRLSYQRIKMEQNGPSTSIASFANTDVRYRKNKKKMVGGYRTNDESDMNTATESAFECANEISCASDLDSFADAEDSEPDLPRIPQLRRPKTAVFRNREDKAAKFLSRYPDRAMAARFPNFNSKD